MLYRYWLRSMPLVVKSRLATSLFALAEKFSRSLTHQAPDAPKPAMVWAGAVTMALVAAPAGVATKAVMAADAARRRAEATGRRVRDLTVTPQLIRARIICRGRYIRKGSASRCGF